jgi:hypothetical protein
MFLRINLKAETLNEEESPQHLSVGSKWCDSPLANTAILKIHSKHLKLRVYTRQGIFGGHP